MDRKTVRNVLDWYKQTHTKEVPTDVVKVVRCKDCKYLGVKDFVYGYCKKRMTGILSPTDYCSDGEEDE